MVNIDSVAPNSRHYLVSNKSFLSASTPEGFQRAIFISLRLNSDMI